MFTRRLPRRRFLQAILASGAIRDAPTWAQTSADREAWVLLGTQNGQGISRARWNAASGQLGVPELAAATPRPTFLALNRDAPVVYAVNENEGSAATVSAFGLQRATATLKPLAVHQTHGSSPCYVSVDRDGELLFTANYGGGSLAAFELDGHGVPSPAAAIFSCADSKLCGTHGPVPDRQDGPHLHCAVTSPDDRFVLACDLGDDAILIFPIHPRGVPVLSPARRIAAREGSGPRHLAFHPNGRWLYCIHELDCTVDLYTWKPVGASVAVDPVLNSIARLASANPMQAPLAGTVPNTGAELAISRDGRFLYASTRGADILTVFSIEPKFGLLDEIQQIPCGGRTPRFFALDPTGHWLLCANQDSDTVTIFARDETTGRLTAQGSQNAPSPMCIVWL